MIRKALVSAVVAVGLITGGLAATAPAQAAGCFNFTKTQTNHVLYYDIVGKATNQCSTHMNGRFKIANYNTSGALVNYSYESCRSLGPSTFYQPAYSATYSVWPGAAKAYPVDFVSC